MGRDDSRPIMVISVVPSYNCADSNLICPPNQVSPCCGFFPTTRMTGIPINSIRPKNPPFSVFHGNRPKWWNSTSDHESDGRFWIEKPKFLFAFHSYHRSISLSDRQTDGWTMCTITIAGPHIVVGQLIRHSTNITIWHNMKLHSVIWDSNIM